MSTKNKERVDIQTEFDQYQLNGYLCEFSPNGCIPLTRFEQDKQRNFFNFHQKVCIFFRDFSLENQIDLFLEKIFICL